MDGTARRRTTGRGRRPVQRTKRSARNGVAEGDRRRLIQLGVSLALFLLVYIGRGVFPAQLVALREAAAANVDFKAVFQQFGTNLAQGEPVRGALETLCAALLGMETETEPEPSPTAKPPQTAPAALSQTRDGGLSDLRQYGFLRVGNSAAKGDEPAGAGPEESGQTPSESEAGRPEVVTAVAQAYTADGVKLPRNVSFDYYELGLSETAVPVEGSATSGFGYRDSPINGKHEFHLALDIGAEEGTEIGAFAAGTVEYIGESDEFGNYLKIRHENNVSSFYAHCSKLLVHKGDEVSCGETVALVGHTGDATGPHLHLTIEKDNIRLDPAYYVDLS